MPVATLRPVADDIDAGWVDSVGGTTDLYAFIDDDPDSPTDDYIQTPVNAGSSGSGLFALTNTPADFGVATAVELVIRAARSSAGDDTKTGQLYVVDSGGSAITGSSGGDWDVTSVGTTYTIFRFTPTLLGAQDKTRWDGARVAIAAAHANVMGADGSTTRVSSVEVNVTYSISGSAVGDTLEARWQVKAALGDTSDLRWQVKAALGDTVDLRWGIRTSFFDTLDIRWGIRTFVGDPLDLRWQVKAALGDTLTPQWNVKANLFDTLQAQWGVRTSIFDTVNLRWGIRTSVFDSLDTRWGVRAAVNDTIQLIWNVLSLVGGAVGDELELRWGIRTTVNDQLDARWSIRTSLGDTVTPQWSVRSKVGDTNEYRWNVRANLFDTVNLRWGVRTPLGDTVNLRWGIRTGVGDQVELHWSDRANVSDSLQLIWNVLAIVSLAVGDEVTIIWQIKNLTSRSVVLQWQILPKMFSPPTQPGASYTGKSPLFRAYGRVPQGITVWKDSLGVFHEMPEGYPSDRLEAEAVIIYSGGHLHPLTAQEAADLEAAGYGDYIT